MNTYTKKRHEKLLSVIAAIVIFCVLTFTIVIRPQVNLRKKYLEQMSQLQLTLNKMRHDLLLKDKIEKIYSQIEPLITSKNTRQQGISSFTRELSDLYSKLNVEIRSVKILPDINEQFYKRLSVKVEMSGHIKDILHFIVSVETYHNSIRIERLDLKAQDIPEHVKASFLITKVIVESVKKVV